MKRSPIRTKRDPDKARRRRDAVAIAFARDGGCVAARMFDHDCVAQLDGHEPLTRARGGDPCDPDNVITLCRTAHDWVHGNPEQAHALGLLRHAWEAS